MSTLQGKIVLVVGGSSGIGFAVAKYAIISHAVDTTVKELTATKAELKLPGEVDGEIVDGEESASVKSLVNRIGEIDHLVWTSGDSIGPSMTPNTNPFESSDVFDVRFWGAIIAAQNAKFRSGGSVILTTGVPVKKPPPGYSVIAGIGGAIDAVVRGLAVDLAPIRVNAVSPGVVDTEIWGNLPVETKNKIMEDTKAKLLVKHVAKPEEIAEAYIFLMKCEYITGQRIDVDGGNSYA
ncbi:NAD-binding protein [Rickenella mellea]|uniref:NAD-binding protein n=1 Tax=Rickenella mellea TaxID=50990 RepID=A0A4Y7PHZ6_9AGAM|nr:NAD-binding protein [Rickenella mellea]